MFSSLFSFPSDQYQIHLKTLLIVLILQLVLCAKLNANEELLEQTRAIGGESLDTSNFVLYIDENKARFIEIPYEFMKQRIQDQKMWRRVRANDRCLLENCISTMFFYLLVVNHAKCSMFRILGHSNRLSYS